MLSSSSLPSSSASSSSSSSSSSSTRRCKSRWFRLSIFLFVGSKVMDSSQSLSSQDRKKNKSNALPSSSTPPLPPSLPPSSALLFLFLCKQIKEKGGSEGEREREIFIGRLFRDGEAAPLPFQSSLRRDENKRQLFDLFGIFGPSREIPGQSMFRGRRNNLFNYFG